MTPSQFTESNKTLLAPTGMDNCDSLPVFTDGKQCISLWRPTWRERLQFLFYGRLWVYVIGGSTQPPIALVIDKTVFKTSFGKEK